MRIIIALLFGISLTEPFFTQVSSKSEMQAQMRPAINELNKQIADLENQIADVKKKKENPEELQQQVAMLKKQVEMMGGVTKGFSTVSDETFQQATRDDNNTGIPKKDQLL